MIMMALSKNPKPTNGIALWKATDEIKPKNMSEISVRVLVSQTLRWLHSGAGSHV